MFSFHRPKVYRSSTGCCICKAKSSSSRFTDSKKYEEDFLECFKLVTPRQGEICNACVLLVKRWKKLPAGSDRNWRHVVDARAGPGMKSLTKFKTKNRKIEAKTSKKAKAPFDRECSPGLSDKSDGPEDVDMADMDCLSEDGPSMGSSRNASPALSDTEDHVERPRGGRSRRPKLKPRRRDPMRVSVDSFIDTDYWTKKTTCCGTVYHGLQNEIMVVRDLYKPCAARLAMQQQQQHKAAPSTAAAVTATPTAAVTKTVYSDNSSDSGYDDSSNQAMSPDAQEKVVAAQAPANQIVDLVCHETIFGADHDEEMVDNVSLSLVSRQDSYPMVVRN